MCSFQGVCGRCQYRGERVSEGLDRRLLGLAALLLRVASGPLDERVQARIGCLAVSYDQFQQPIDHWSKKLYRFTIHSFISENSLAFRQSYIIKCGWNRDLIGPRSGWRRGCCPEGWPCSRSNMMWTRTVYPCKNWANSEWPKMI